MVVIFFAITLLLLLLSLVLIAPAFKYRQVFFLAIPLTTLSYTLYFHIGSSHHLKEYYSKEKIANRLVRSHLQPMFTALKKQEYRLRIHVDSHPEDVIAQSQLFEILGVQALQERNLKLARQCFSEALNKMSKGCAEHDCQLLALRKKHLETLLLSMDSGERAQKK